MMRRDMAMESYGKIASPYLAKIGAIVVEIEHGERVYTERDPYWQGPDSDTSEADSNVTSCCSTVYAFGIVC
ncbi:hypothetical protein GSI_09346 [Ganoderma sinense ZZ0214-1]|uniref:Uncharacterized protein n=1 Tax=Ganoderma sinense ZZ0214-1 TaxID=1077348 RepID=A0A2G8S6B9_9APHY|nr:hypothetical protein GSI_09346 [Ganoderma sinense ZZ0214-1]